MCRGAATVNRNSSPLSQGEGEEARDSLDGLNVELRVATIEAVFVVSARDPHDLDGNAFLCGVLHSLDDFKPGGHINVAGDDDDGSGKLAMAERLRVAAVA